MRHVIGAVLAATAFTVAVLGVGAAVGASSARSGGAPRGDTIVEVTGNRQDGFTIRHYDGSVDHPPTITEARAECAEYDARLDRVRCRVETRVWYRDLGQIKRAIAYAKSGS